MKKACSFPENFVYLLMDDDDDPFVEQIRYLNKNLNDNLHGCNVKFVKTLVEIELVSTMQNPGEIKEVPLSYL